jgi:hypothetical protein
VRKNKNRPAYPSAGGVNVEDCKSSAGVSARPAISIIIVVVIRAVQSNNPREHGAGSIPRFRAAKQAF